MYLDNYIQSLGNIELRKNVETNSKQIFDKATCDYDYKSVVNGLLLGNVQSGKTAQILGAISRFADNSYKIFLILTSDNNNLQQQTYNRVKISLTGCTVLSEQDVIAFRSLNKSKPVIIVLKKNSSILLKWRNLLCAEKTCQSKVLVIFDDEGDNASLNTLVNKQRTSTINKHIDSIKATALGCIYISVTATPQAVLLQSSVSNWQPKFVHYFEPGKGYLGGNFFYSYPKPFCIEYTDENEIDDVKIDDMYCPNGLQTSIVYFLIICAHKRLSGEVNCNFVIHPSARIDVHEQFTRKVQNHLNLLESDTNDESFVEALRIAYENLKQSKPNLEDFDDLKDVVDEILQEMLINIYTLNSKSFVGKDPKNPNSLDLSKGFNIIVGGNTLGRGLTFPNLQIVYYCRSSKVMQADTAWQHSRIFGYDRERELVRIFIPKSLYLVFGELNRSNNVLINQIKAHGLNSIEVVYPRNIKPTRKNVLDKEYLSVIVGGVNMFPYFPIENNTALVDKIVADYDNDRLVDASIKDIIEILHHTGSYNSDDFDSAEYINCIIALEKKRPRVKFKLLIRTDRDISKGTGTLLSPNDRTLSDSIVDDVVLVIYRVNGDKSKGWDGNPLWIPNIKFPSDSCFYTTK